MNNFMQWMQKKLIPPMAKIGNNKYLVAIRDGLVITLPAVIGGSIFLIIGNIPITAWTNFIKPYSWMLGEAVNASFGIISLLATIGIAYQLGKALKIDSISCVGLSVMAFILTSFNEKHVLDYNNLGSSGIFTAILTAFIASFIFDFFIKKNIVIKLPNGVPTAVSNSFVALLPGMAVLFLFWLVRVVLNININQVVQAIFHPVVFALNTLPGILVYTLIVSLLWVCGIHGDMTLEGIADPIFLQYLAANATAYAHHQALPYVTASGFSSLLVNVGGTGATLTLCALMLFSKSKTYRDLGRLAFPSSLFEINEPIIFGFPIVMNPMIMIPFIVVPLVLATLSYILITIGWMSAPVVMVPWTMPPIIGPMMACGWDWRAGVWSAVECILAAAMYYPFFKACERQMLAKEQTNEAK
ncbi:PTS sugar transporter subunit IIC [Lactobacillus amylovorus]|uniref:PTS sugar transporter subunit IIC n=1 Tax=Lactobacillus amylovorus TaxID=1604 RepID=UPI00232EDE77|nr:PTS sugar transporter subunit IIC [Lactobacillus amylovorus]MDB6243823.1 PTS sugar transporter subunit IIC [Lactobacillus amylovorus]MDB6245499.1 PTS sugar transporter subunit IIC [Lactobacillus amylovorus]MDB6249423.1 PTS sugar transporter subunit IIC [Lactobacillus amylovorus]MDB6252850.1 PTS sugar transporter subunit IIC [Lactobacillus amylovorus]MDB6256252.1 PTS sugar transporter subunit IIC [Lactobacillus amylovorus]